MATCLQLKSLSFIILVFISTFVTVYGDEGKPNFVEEEDAGHKDRDSLILSLLNDKDEQLRLRAAQLLNATEIEKPPDIDSVGIDPTNEKSRHNENVNSNQKTKHEGKFLPHDEIPTYKESNDKDSNQLNSESQQLQSTKESNENHDKSEELLGVNQEEYENETDSSPFLDNDETKPRAQSHYLDVNNKQFTQQLNETHESNFLDKHVHNKKEESENFHDKEELSTAKTKENNKNVTHEQSEHATSSETYNAKENKSNDIHEKFKDTEWKKENTFDTNMVEDSHGSSHFKGEHNSNSSDILNVKRQKIKDNIDVNATAEVIEKQERNDNMKDGVGNELKSQSEIIQKEDNFDTDEQESKTEELDTEGDVVNEKSKTEGLDTKGDDVNVEVEDSGKDLPDNPKEPITEMKDDKKSHTIRAGSDGGLQRNQSFTVTPSSSSASSATAKSTTTYTTIGSTSIISLLVKSKITKSTPSTILRSLNFEWTSSPFGMVSKSLFSSTSLGATKFLKTGTEIPATKSTTGSSLMDHTLSSYSRKKGGSEKRIMSVQEKNACSINRDGLYGTSALASAVIGGAFIGGFVVFLFFYCKAKFSKFYKGNYQRVPMEYDFELNPRLKSHNK